jgi:hypothetical protein
MYKYFLELQSCWDRTLANVQMNFYHLLFLVLKNFEQSLRNIIAVYICMYSTYLVCFNIYTFTALISKLNTIIKALKSGNLVAKFELSQIHQYFFSFLNLEVSEHPCIPPRREILYVL